MNLIYTSLDIVSKLFYKDMYYYSWPYFVQYSWLLIFQLKILQNFRLPINMVKFGKILNFWRNISNFPINVYMIVEYSRCTNKNTGVE